MPLPSPCPKVGQPYCAGTGRFHFEAVLLFLLSPLCTSWGRAGPQAPLFQIPALTQAAFPRGHACFLRPCIECWRRPRPRCSKCCVLMTYPALVPGPLVLLRVHYQRGPSPSLLGKITLSSEIQGRGVLCSVFSA